MEQCVRLSVQPDTVSVTVSEVQVQSVVVSVYVYLDVSECVCCVSEDLCDGEKCKKERCTEKLSCSCVTVGNLSIILSI